MRRNDGVIAPYGVARITLPGTRHAIVGVGRNTHAEGTPNFAPTLCPPIARRACPVHTPASGGDGGLEVGQ